MVWSHRTTSPANTIVGRHVKEKTVSRNVAKAKCYFALSTFKGIYALLHRGDGRAEINSNAHRTTRSQIRVPQVIVIPFLCRWGKVSSTAYEDWRGVEW